MKKEKLVLLGGGGHCHAVIDVIELQEKYEIIGIVDKKELLGTKVLGYEVIGSDEDLATIYKECRHAIITVGQITSNAIRVTLFKKLKAIGFTLPVVVSPLAYVAKSATLKEGTIVMHRALINANASVGENCIINTQALVEHDAIVEDFCHISTGAIINGGTRVKENSFIGSNAVTKEYIEISGFIKAGSIAK